MDHVFQILDQVDVHIFQQILVLDPKCIKLIPKKFYDMTSLFKKIIANKHKTISFPLGEYWIDIGRFNDYKKANLEYNSNFKII